MKGMKLLSVAVGVSVFILLAGLPETWAQCEGPPGGGSPITVDPQASGTKVFGTVTIYYEYDGGASGCVQSGAFAKAFFIRVSKGNTLLPFSDFFPTNLPSGPICEDDISAQQTVIEAYAQANIVPVFKPKATTMTIKAVDALVQNSSSPLFVMMDIVAAIK